MGLLDAIRAPFRWFTRGAFAELNALRGIFETNNTDAGVPITEKTALQIAAVFAAIRIISESVAKVPLILMQDTDTSTKHAKAHRLYQIMRRRPNPYTPASSFWQAIMGHALLGGNGYAEIEADGAGRPIGLWLLNPDHVTPGPNEEGGVVYLYAPPGLTKAKIPHNRIFHLRGPGPDGFQGYSVLQLAKESFGLTAAAEKFGSKFFGNGAKPSAVVEVPMAMSDDAFERFKKDIREANAGLSNAHRIAFLEGGAKWVQTSISPEDAQFLETRGFQIEEIARWFNCPVSKLRVTSQKSYATLEQEDRAFLNETLQPWFVRIQEEAWFKLLTEPEQNSGYVFDHLIDAFALADISSIVNSAAQCINWGMFNADDGRAKLRMDPLPDGKGQTYLQPLNMQPLNAPKGASAPSSTPAVGAAPTGAPTTGTPSGSAAGADPSVDIQATALNGAQIASLLEIVVQVATGVLPIGSAKAIAQAAFPFLDPAIIDDIFAGIEVKPLPTDGQAAGGSP